MIPLVFLVLQYIVSAKAGLVNYLDGQTNVSLHQQVTEGASIETFERGHVELLLNPGSFLRLGEHSTVVLDSTDLDRIAIRLVDGNAMIEAAEISKQQPIQVEAGNLRVRIVAPGVYRFAPGRARVLDGKLQVIDSSLTVKKGHEITRDSESFAQQTSAIAFADDLDRWNEQRSLVVSRANALAYREQRTIASNGPVWLFSPILGGFTFFPLRAYHSYYGYTFVPVSVFRPSTTVVTRPPASSSTRSGVSAPVRSPSARSGGGGFHGGRHSGGRIGARR